MFLLHVPTHLETPAMSFQSGAREKRLRKMEVLTLGKSMSSILRYSQWMPGRSLRLLRLRVVCQSFVFSYYSSHPSLAPSYIEAVRLGVIIIRYRLLILEFGAVC